MHKVQMTNSGIQWSRRNDVRIQNAARLKIDLRWKEMGSDEGRHNGWRMEQPFQRRTASVQVEILCRKPGITV